MRYSSNPLSKKCHFGHVGGADRNLTFVLQKTAVTTGKSKERKERVSKASMVTLREIISDGLSKTDYCTSYGSLLSSLVTPLTRMIGFCMTEIISGSVR